MKCDRCGHDLRPGSQEPHSFWNRELARYDNLCTNCYWKALEAHRARVKK